MHEISLAKRLSQALVYLVVVLTRLLTVQRDVSSSDACQIQKFKDDFWWLVKQQKWCAEETEGRARAAKRVASTPTGG